MDEIKQENIESSNVTAVTDDVAKSEEPTKYSTDETTTGNAMDVAVDDDVAKDGTNDAKVTATTTADIKIEETDDSKMEEVNVEDGNDVKKEAEEMEETEEQNDVKEPSETIKTTASGKKKRKKSVEGEAVTNTKTDTASATKRSSRDRKSVEVYDPKIYDKTEKAIQITEGRGTALKNIRPCKDAIESAAASSVDDLQTAFRFVFGSKYKLPSKKEMIQHLLDFNGYLPKKDSSLSKDEQEKVDEEQEVKFGARAYKLTIPGLKKLCDFFAVDRYLTPSKDGLVDKLLDFLGEPKKDKIKGGSGQHGSDAATSTKTTKKSKPTKRAKTAKSDKDEEEEDDEREEDAEDVNDEAEDDDYDDVDDDKLQNGDTDVALPSQEKLRKWVRAYVRCFNESKLTVNHALVVGSEKFGVDLLPMKADLKKLLIEEV